MRALNDLQKELERLPELRVELRISAENRDLATRRADSLKGYLVERGISPDRIVAKVGEPGEERVVVVPIRP